MSDQTNWPEVVNDILEMSKELSDKLSIKRMTYGSIAVEIGTSTTTIHRIVHEDLEPKYSQGASILAIHQVTKRKYKRVMKKEIKCP